MSIYATTTIVTTQAFWNASNALFDPSVVKCKVRSPSGVETTYTYGSSSNLTKVSTGSYKCTFDATAGGIWVATWKGSDTGGARTDEYTVEVKDTKTTAF